MVYHLSQLTPNSSFLSFCVCICDARTKHISIYGIAKSTWIRWAPFCAELGLAMQRSIEFILPIFNFLSKSLRCLALSWQLMAMQVGKPWLKS